MCIVSNRQYAVFSFKDYPDSFDAVSDLVENQLTNLIKSKNITDLPTAFVKVQDHYNSCMDEDAIEKRGIVPVKMAIKRYGGWPVIDTRWNAKNYDWIKTTRLLVNDGHASNVIVNLYVDVSTIDTTKSMIQMDKPVFDIPKIYLLAGINDTISQAYYQAMVEMAVAFGACRSVAQEQMADVFEFESQLAIISANEDPDSPYAQDSEVKSISQIIKDYSNIPWMAFINAVFGNTFTFTNNEQINVVLPSYYERLGPIIAKTPKRVIANFLIWRMLLQSTYYLNKRIWNIRYMFENLIYDAPNITRSSFCYEVVTYKDWAPIVGAAYIRRFVNPDTKGKATELVKLIQNQLVNMFSSEEWMDEPTRAEAVEKVKNIFLEIGYPDELLDNKFMDDYYKDLKIVKGDFYNNAFNNMKWNMDKKNQKLREAFNLTSWDNFALYMTDVDAGYDDDNTLDLLAPILQGIFFSEDRPFYLNLGTIGTVAAHELTHSVDTEGSQYDSKGRLRNWWSNSSLANFNEKVERIVEEYSSYFVKEVNMTLNGNLESIEAIADQGGIKLSRLVLEDWLSKNPTEKFSRIAGLEKYAPEQLYWISWANVFCRRFTRPFLAYIVRNNEHPPNEFRVNVAMRNSPEFALDWNCPAGSYMNKNDKVNVW